MKAALPSENGLLDRVELRGLEPLTPTLPGRLVGVHRRPLPFISAGQATVRPTMNSLEQA
jgi:hypothetical protein